MKSILRAPLHLANNLTITAAGYALDARQGAALQAALERKAPGGVGAEVLLSAAGWYRVARFKAGTATGTQGAWGGALVLAYATGFSHYGNVSGLLSVNLAHQAGAITPLGGAKYRAVDQVISQARLVYSTEDATTYIELYYALDKNNPLYISIIGGELSTALRWEVMRPTPTSGTPTVYATADLTQPAATAQEVGAWVPTLYGSTTAGSPTYSQQWGVYVRQGRLVWISGRLTVQSAGGMAGSMSIRGLPFAMANRGAYASIHFPYVRMEVAGRPVTGMVIGGTAEMVLYAGQTEYLQAAGVAEATQIYFSGTYLT